MIVLKMPEQIEAVNKANKIVHSALDLVEAKIKEGISTIALDKLAEEYACDQQSTLAFKGYNGFPNALCVSINEEIVHGIPSGRQIKNGDIVSVDFGVKYGGYCGDAARTIIVGEVDERVESLVKNTRKALYDGIEAMKVGNRLYDINQAIENVAQKNGYGNVRCFSGHGIGTNLHEQPSVFNYVNKKIDNIRLQDGMILALEPMFSLGSGEVKILDDNWTAITADYSVSAHWELSVAIVDGKPKILGA